jgi:hypothetical protein
VGAPSFSVLPQLAVYSYPNVHLHLGSIWCSHSTYYSSVGSPGTRSAGLSATSR